MYDLTKMPMLCLYLATWEKKYSETKGGAPNQDDEKANTVTEVADKADGNIIMHKTARETQENGKVDDAVINKDEEAAAQKRNE